MIPYQERYIIPGEEYLSKSVSALTKLVSYGNNTLLGPLSCVPYILSTDKIEKNGYLISYSDKLYFRGGYAIMDNTLLHIPYLDYGQFYEFDLNDSKNYIEYNDIDFTSDNAPVGKKMKKYYFDVFGDTLADIIDIHNNMNKTVIETIPYEAKVNFPNINIPGSKIINRALINECLGYIVLSYNRINLNTNFYKVQQDSLGNIINFENLKHKYYYTSSSDFNASIGDKVIWKRLREYSIHSWIGTDRGYINPNANIGRIIYDELQIKHLVRLSGDGVVSIKILKDINQFDPRKYIFLGMVIFVDEGKILPYVLPFDFFYDPVLDKRRIYVTRSTINWTPELYNDLYANEATKYNFIDHHQNAGLHNCMVVCSYYDDTIWGYRYVAFSGETNHSDIRYIGSYTKNMDGESGISFLYTGESYISIDHNFNRILHVQVLEKSVDVPTEYELMYCDVSATNNNFKIYFSESYRSKFNSLLPTEIMIIY